MAFPAPILTWLLLIIASVLPACNFNLGGALFSAFCWQFFDSDRQILSRMFQARTLFAQTVSIHRDFLKGIRENPLHPPKVLVFFQGVVRVLLSYSVYQTTWWPVRASGNWLSTCGAFVYNLEAL
jgi:hypothetical protein